MMLMVVVVTFFLCNVLAMVSNILEVFDVNAVVVTQVTKVTKAEKKILLNTFIQKQLSIPLWTMEHVAKFRPKIC